MQNKFNIIKKILLFLVILLFLYFCLFFTFYFLNNGDLKKSILHIDEYNLENVKNSIIENKADTINSSLGKDNLGLGQNKTGLELNTKYSSLFSPKFGNKEALVHVIMFVDFDCPFSEGEYKIFQRVMERYKDKGYFEIRQFPLETIHSNSRDLANVSLCANSQGKFFEMVDRIFFDFSFRQNSELEVSTLYNNYAKSIKLDMEQFNKCFQNKTYNNIVNKDLLDGLKFGIEGTPIFIINGKMIAGALKEQDWDTIFKMIK